MQNTAMRLTELAHNYLSEQLGEGDHALDATSGNGYDTLQMAKLVGPLGHVIAIDIQEAAIAATRTLLESNNCLKQVELLLEDHSTALQSLCRDHAQSFSAITFNLGYLPGSDKHVLTRPETTIKALDPARELLKPNGLLLVTAYRGHGGGQVEADHVAQWMQQLSTRDWQWKTHDPSIDNNKENQPPILWAVRKLYNTKNEQIAK